MQEALFLLLLLHEKRQYQDCISALPYSWSRCSQKTFLCHSWSPVTFLIEVQNWQQSNWQENSWQRRICSAFFSYRQRVRDHYLQSVIQKKMQVLGASQGFKKHFMPSFQAPKAGTGLQVHSIPTSITRGSVYYFVIQTYVWEEHPGNASWWSSTVVTLPTDFHYWLTLRPEWNWMNLQFYPIQLILCFQFLIWSYARKIQTVTLNSNAKNLLPTGQYIYSISGKQRAVLAPLSYQLYDALDLSNSILHIYSLK